MPSRGNRSDVLRFASVAAVVLAIMVAVPVLLLAGGGGDDDDAATSAESADDGLAAMDAVASGGDGADGAAEMSAAEEGTERSSEDGGGEAAASDDGEMAATESAFDDAEPALEAPQDEMAEADAEESFADEPLDDAALDAIFDGVPRIDLDQAATPRDLRRQVQRQLAASAAVDATGDDGAEDSDLSAEEFACRGVLAAEAADGANVLAIGTAMLDDRAVEYVIVGESLSMVVVVDAVTCGVVFAN